MTEDPRARLRSLEEDYSEQPPLVQKSDLEEINALRQDLGLPLVDSQLNPLNGGDTTPAAADLEGTPSTESAPPAKTTELQEDHSEARAIYTLYLQKEQELAPHREYADKVCKATSGRGQTPVEPLATMGPDGGPLLCDYCGRPIILEGGKFHNVPADQAWEKNPQKGWKSWIYGGLVVELQTNGTLRIYHGYPLRDPSHCCNRAAEEFRKQRAEFDSSKRSKVWRKVLAFLEQEFPNLPPDEKTRLVNDVLEATCGFDPGLGVNHP